MNPPPPNPDDLLERFLLAHPQYRPHVTWSEQHKGYAMPAWLGEVFHAWAIVQVHPPTNN